MSSLTNTSLRKAAADLSQVINSSLGGNRECMKAIANIEEMINSLEQKINGLPAKDPENNLSEALSFAPETVVSKV